MAKTELGERRIWFWFWFGRHGEFEKLKDERIRGGCCWAEDGGGLESRKAKMRKRRQRRFNHRFHDLFFFF